MRYDFTPQYILVITAINPLAVRYQVVYINIWNDIFIARMLFIKRNNMSSPNDNVISVPMYGIDNNLVIFNQAEERHAN